MNEALGLGLASMFGLSLIPITIGLIFSAIFWLLIRPLVIWYFKINEIVELLQQINDKFEINNKPIDQTIEKNMTKAGYGKLKIKMKQPIKKKLKTEHEKWGPKSKFKIN